jgi:hypothetical protein
LPSFNKILRFHALNNTRFFSNSFLVSQNNNSIIDNDKLLIEFKNKKIKNIFYLERQFLE